MANHFLAGALILACAAIAGGIGNAIVVSQYLKGIARQPGAAGQLRTAFFLGAALVEAIPIIGTIFGILVLMKIIGS